MAKGARATGWFNNGSKPTPDLEARVSGSTILDVATTGIEVTGTVTASTGATVTAGNISMTAGTIDLNDGGTITQATNKGTGVTLNTHSGQITMNGAALAAAAEITFTVTNSTVGAYDVVVVNHGSAGTAGSYLVSTSAIATGSFKITVANTSTGSLSEAIVLHFAVIGGANS